MTPSTKAIIIGTDYGIRRLDSNNSSPALLSELGHGKFILDWILQSFNSQNIEKQNIIFVGGYHIEKVIEKYPSLKYHFIPEWKSIGPAGVLKRMVDEITDNCFVCDDRIVFRKNSLLSIKNVDSDIVIGTIKDSDEGERNVGLLWVNKNGAAILKDFIKNVDDVKLNLADLFTKLQNSNISVSNVNLGKDCVELSDEMSLANFVLGNKAQTLERLRPIVKNAVILNQIRFAVKEWISNPLAVFSEITEAFHNTNVVVRSCSSAEDSFASSQAGHFTSVLNVEPANQEQLKNAINSVIDSYKSKITLDELGNQEIFVQPHLNEVSSCGVILTCDLDTGAPYYIVTVDNLSGKTDVVTSGVAGELETFIIYPKTPLDKLNSFQQNIVRLVDELVGLIGYDKLDLEFAVDSNGQFYLFQVRPVVEKNKKFILNKIDFDDELNQTREFIELLMQPHSRLLGKTTMFGNMPDWNPAEMIGVSPRPLALSLYQVLITDYAWAEARKQTMYRDVTSEPLMMSFAGSPYIDIRASLNSFIPSALPSELAESLVDCYIEYLREKPELHDKIEFDVAVTCLDFNFDTHSKRLTDKGFSKKDLQLFKTNLFDLTNAILCGKIAPINELGSKIKRLKELRASTINFQNNYKVLPSVISRLTKDCINYGTIPFSILARYGFIASSFLKSLVEKEIFTAEECQLFLNNVPTVASEVTQGIESLKIGKINVAEFNDKFGHLRPGTYDILSDNYSQRTEYFLSKSDSQNTTSTDCPDVEKAIKHFMTKEGQINKLLSESGFSCDSETLLEFIIKSIQGREWGKFEFSKNINQILETTSEFADLLGFTKNEFSYISIEEIIRLSTNSPSCAIKTQLKRLIGYAKKRHSLTLAVRFPHLITSPDDINLFKLKEWHPNYITHKKIIADVVNFENNPQPENIKNKIVAIQSADPGYDWIFSCQIGGLITEFGGAASHMAIRASEFGLPAAIGCGDVIFERVKNAKRIELDCANQNIRVII